MNNQGIIITLNKIIKFLVIFLSLSIFLFALGFFLWRNYFASEKIFFTADYPLEIMSGEEITIKLNYDNQTKRTLYEAEIVLELPENSFDNDWSPLKIIRIPLGDIEEGEKGEKEVSLRILGKNQKNKNILTYLSWKASGFKVPFKKEKIINITFSQPIVSLDLLTPKKILPQIPFNLEIAFQNNLDKEIYGLELKINLPEEYEILNSQPEIDNFQKIFLKKLSSKEKRKITLRGIIKGEIYQIYPFSTEIGLNRGEFISLEKKEGEIPLGPSPLSIDISLENEDDNAIFHLGDEISYIISYQNRAETALSDVIVRAHLDTEETKLLDFSSLSTDGYFDLKTKTITWNAGNHPSLKVLKPNQKDEVRFQIKLKDNFPLNELKNSKGKNFVLKIKSEIETPTVPYDIEAEKLSNSTEQENKVADKIDFVCQILFRDAKSGFLNKGPFPVRVGQSTQFTFHFIIKNYANDLEKVKIFADLAEGVTWLNKFKNNSWPDFNYQERISRIYWQAEEIPAWQGIFSEEVHLIGQISFTPQPSQRGKAPFFLKNIHLRAKDSFTGQIYDIECPNLGLANLRFFDKTISSQDQVVR